MPYTPPAGDAIVLEFAGSYAPPAGGAIVLDFNAANANEITVNALFDDLAVDMVVGIFPQISISAALDDMSAVVDLEWLAGVFRGLETSRGTGYDDRRDYTEQTLSAPHAQATATPSITAMPWQYGKTKGPELRGGWSVIARRRTDYLAKWQRSPQKSAGLQSRFFAPAGKHAEKNQRWQSANVAELMLQAGYRSPPRLDKQAEFVASSAAAMVGEIGLPFGVAALRYLQHEAIVWGDGNPHSWIWGGWIAPPVPPPPLYTPSTDLIFYQRQEDYTGGAILVFGTPCYAWPLSAPPTHLINGVYIVIHAISVKRTADNVNIPTESVTLQFDIDSWCWSISLNLKTAAAMALLEPIAGEPREVRIDLDGTYITGIIESYGERRVFGETTYTASGRSSLALFSAPFAPLRSYAETSQKTAAQLIDHELTGTGWTAAYHSAISQLFATDWLVPAGAWSYQNKSPIDAIVQIAKASGARAYADKAAATVHVDPRYPVSPWDWATATVDNTIPISLARSISTRLAPQPNYNHVYVSGVNQGVLVSATRYGSAGDMPAPMITDTLITYANAGSERARNVLANVGRQARVTMDLPLNTVTGLLEPGNLVEVTDAANWRGLVVGTSISAAHGAISQQVEIERHYA